MQIALNVNRTRITVLGFNLAVLLFLTGSLFAIGRHLEVRAMWIFLPSYAQISIGISLTFASLMLILISQRFDSPHSVGPLWFSSGELLMYLALAQTLGAASQLFVGGFVFTFQELPAELVGSAAAAEISRTGQHLTGWIHAFAAVVWFGVTYFAPGVFLFRLSLARRRKLVLGAGYVVVLSVVFWISSSAYHLHARARGENASRIVKFVEQVWQPRLWRDPSLSVTEFPGVRATRAEQEGS
jgi:hypothetical protein